MEDAVTRRLVRDQVVVDYQANNQVDTRTGSLPGNRLDNHVGNWVDDPDAVKIGKLYAQAVAAKGNNTETFQHYLRAGYALIVKRRVMLREPDIRSDDWSAWLTGNCEALGFGAWTAGLLMRAADRFQFETDFKFGESESAAGLHWMDKQWQSSPVDVAVKIREELAFQRISSKEALRAEWKAACRAALRWPTSIPDDDPIIEHLTQRGVIRYGPDPTAADLARWAKQRRRNSLRVVPKTDALAEQPAETKGWS